MRSELHCRNCGVLLGVWQADGVTICRGRLRVTAHGGSRLTVVCYRCSRIQLLEVQSESGRSTDTENLPEDTKP